MKLLTLVRHAKSGWPTSGQSDHDRTLDQQGRSDAPAMAKRLQLQGSLPTKIICSTAQRTRETCDLFLEALGLQKELVTYEDALYLATTGTLQSYIENTDNSVEHLLVLSHNPGLEQLAPLLHPGAPKALAPCAMVQYQLDQTGFSLDNADTINLVWHDSPNNH